MKYIIAISILFLLSLSLIHTQVSALLSNGDFGVETCSSDVEGEKKLHETLVRLINAYITIQKTHEDYNETTVQNTVLNSLSYSNLKTNEQCLTSLGVDVSSLSQISVPEFSSLVGMIMTISIIGVVVISRRLVIK